VKLAHKAMHNTNNGVKVFIQKLNYIHQNPVRAGLCSHAEEYKYSSAKFYETGIDNGGFLTHFTG
jgi:putative transposase